MTSTHRHMQSRANAVEAGDRFYWLQALLPILRWCAAAGIPVLFFAGAMTGSNVQIAEQLAATSDIIYQLFAYGSWIALAVVAGIVELLAFNRAYFTYSVRIHTSLALRSIGLFFAESVLLILCALCATASGAVLGRVWSVQSAGHAFVIVLASLFFLATLYWVVVTSESDQVLHARTEEQPLPTDKAALTEPKPGAEYEVPWSRETEGLDSLAGMEDLKKEIRQAITGFRTYSTSSTAGGTGGTGGPVGGLVLSESNGMLLSGPPGNGKTSFARAIAAELRLPLLKVGTGELTSKWVNESSKVIKEVFRQASTQPCVLFFDEFDGVAQSRGNGQQHGEDRKVVNTLLAEIDNARRLPIVLIAATNFAEQLDPAIVRDGRFDFKIEIPFPDVDARRTLLRSQLDKHNLLVERPVLDQVATLWERRSAAFIESAVRRVRDMVKVRAGFVATIEDFKTAALLAGRMPSALPRPGPSLSEIALPANVRQEAKGLVYRLKNWEQIAQRGGEVPTGVMLYGPPGTGKTHFVNALARELVHWHVFEVRGSELNRDPSLFRKAVEQAYVHRPAIVFLDEADEVLADRSSSWASAGATNEILKVMDGAGGKVPEIVFMAATNRIEMIDSAALRAGRFGERIFMGPLTCQDLEAFLQMEFAALTNVRFDPDLTPRSMSELLVQETPADAASILRKAINFTLNGSHAHEIVSLALVRQVSAERSGFVEPARH